MPASSAPVRPAVSPLTVQELRTAIVQGIDRQSIIQQVFYGQSEIPVDFWPAGHAGHDSGLEGLAYDPDAAAEMLDSLGWLRLEDDPDGIRIAASVPGVMYGTKLSFKLTIADTPFAKKAAGMVQENFALLTIGTVVLVPITEELLFRGLIFRGIYNRSHFWAYAISAVAFSLPHVVGYIGFYDPLLLLLCFVQYLPAGLCLGWAYARADSIFAPTLMHMIINLIGMLAMR